jgi:hypothetical protein
MEAATMVTVTTDSSNFISSSSSSISSSADRNNRDIHHIVCPKGSKSLHGSRVQGMLSTCSEQATGNTVLSLLIMNSFVKSLLNVIPIGLSTPACSLNTIS